MVSWSAQLVNIDSMAAQLPSEKEVGYILDNRKNSLKYLVYLLISIMLTLVKFSLSNIFLYVIHSSHSDMQEKNWIQYTPGCVYRQLVCLLHAHV